MKAEDINIAIEAANKFVFFGWNFPMTDYSYEDSWGETRHYTLPRFLTEVKWTCGTHHMIGKWEKACDKNNSDAYLIRFYSELDRENRRRLIEYVMLNYDGELKIV